MARMHRPPLALLLVAALAPSALAQDAPHAFVGARVLPISGPAIDDGVLLVHHGKIEAVGTRASVALPANAVVVDVKGKVLMPGLVDTHSHVGGGWGADESAPIQASVRMLDAIDCRDAGFQRAQAGGITTVNVMSGSGHLMGGQTLYLKNKDVRSIEEMCYRFADGAPMGGMKMANGTNSHRDPPFPGTRGKSAALVRESFVAAQEYERKLRAAGTDESKKPARDLAMEGLLEVLSGRRIVHHHTHRHDDILTVLRLAKEFNFRVVLHHVSEAWKVASEIAAAKIPCSLIEIDSPGGKLEAADFDSRSAAELEKRGAPELVAFHTDDWITDSRLFLRSAGLAVRAGLSRETALAGLTLNPARMFDLGDRVGSLERGKDADFLVLSGDPLSVYTTVEQTWAGGDKVFDHADAKDRLWAEGGWGAGLRRAGALCCLGDGEDR
ncbi:MAG: amidohydrolase family protein [Planctomycetes bacterium]|nr:amidohydrolase family protein [Planctomycetota bacterium]